MKYLPFLWSSLWRAKARTGFTLASIVVAFVLYALLQTVNAAFERGPRVTGANRLISNSLYTITETIPLSYLAQIAHVPGVQEISHSTWFGASYQESSKRFGMFAVDHLRHFAVLKELSMPAEQLKAFQTTRTAMVAGQGLADQMGWKVGDHIPIKSDIWGQSNGSYTWEFDLVGIYGSADADDDMRTNSAYLRYDYFDEARVFAKGTVSLFVFNIAQGRSGDAIAAAIDKQFANSPHETKTQTEAQFSQQFAKQLGDIGLIVSGILAAVFFTLLILTGNTIMQSVRERIPELAVLKTLGFKNHQVMALVLAESLLLCTMGAAIGVILGFIAVEALRKPLKSIFPVFNLPPETAVNALLLGLLLALLVGIPPAIRALRLSIVDALAGR